MPGYISGDIIKGAFHSADLLFFPSYEETEGIVVLEALASKLPVLVRDIGVYKPWLKDGISCYMGKNNDDFINKIDYIFK
ncbi:MAG: glycosyltransferase [Clostridium sp.]|nr:MAG: glycosyltransferase [Clostridium sp.]